MNDYVIEEIIDIIFDTDKYLTVKFRVDLDSCDEFRELEDNDFYYWCEENFIKNDEEENINNDFYEDENELLDYYFDFDKWIDTFKNEEVIIKYIYEKYPTYIDLPNFI